MNSNSNQATISIRKIMQEDLSPEENAAVEKFRLLMKDEIPSDLADDHTLYYRFMRARDFKLHQAEVMLRKHIEWRKQNGMATFFQEYKSKEVLDKYLPQNFIGFDKEGCPIRYAVPGRVDIKGILKSVSFNDVIEAVGYVVEYDIRQLKKQSEKLGRDVTQFVYLYDLRDITLAKAFHKKGIDLFLTFISLCQDNYPERLKRVYIFNAPPYIATVFAIFSKIMSTRVLQKVRYFGTEGWQDALLEVIDAEVLPAFLGGKKTDPDGNPLCLTFVNHGGEPVPEHYFRKSVQRVLKAMPSAKKLMVNARSKAEVPLNVLEPGSFIEWEFQTLDHDIGLGLYFRKEDEESICLLPIERKDANTESLKGMHKCTKTGTYILLFDNSYSWLHSKEVFYQATVISPTHENGRMHES